MKTSIKGFGQPIVSSGVSVTSTGTAVTANIPTNSSGYSPQAVRITATASAHVRPGATATTNDLMIQAGDAVHLNCCGNSWISVISNSGTAIVTIAPIETGIWMREFAPTASLALDFVSSPSLDQRVTFTRASSATRVNGSGVIVSMSNDQPRFDYDPVTLAPKGLLIEEQRTNLLLRSSDYSATWYTSNVTPTANTTETLDPSGANGSTKFVVGASSGSLGQGITSTAVAHTASVYLKTNTGTTQVDILLYRNSPFAVVTTKTVTVTTSWQRFDVSGTFLDTTQHNFQINYGTNKTVYTWGAQLEAGAFATSYIPTTTASATRAADVATMTGANFSSWYNQSAGTLYSEFSGPADPVLAAKIPVSVNDGTTSYRVAIVSTSATVEGRVVVGGIPTNPAAVSITANTTVKSAIAYTAGAASQYTNGTFNSSVTPTAAPAVNQLGVGSQVSTFQLNGWLRKIAYFNRRLANSELQALTA